MRIEAKTEIKGSKEKVWSVITDIENSDKNISGINSIEIINKPKDSLVGLKWREGRTMFGKEAFETMWITDAKENTYYQTRAESHGAIYISRFDIQENDDNYCTLIMSFDGQPQTAMGKFMNFIFSKPMNKSLIKTVEKDLENIKDAVENS